MSKSYLLRFNWRFYLAFLQIFLQEDLLIATRLFRSVPMRLHEYLKQFLHEFFQMFVPMIIPGNFNSNYLQDFHQECFHLSLHSFLQWNLYCGSYWKDSKDSSRIFLGILSVGISLGIRQEILPVILQAICPDTPSDIPLKISPETQVKKSVQGFLRRCLRGFLKEILQGLHKDNLFKDYFVEGL